MANGRDRYWVKWEKGELGKGVVGLDEMVNKFGNGRNGTGQNQWSVQSNRDRRCRYQIIQRLIPPVMVWIIMKLDEWNAEYA